MSLRKSPELTPELLDAARANSRRSTGPRQAAAKRHSRMNALKHGGYVSRQNQRRALRALGEDPERFEALRVALASSLGAGDAFFEQQVEDLAWLYWRRERLERLQAGLKRRALGELERRERRRRLEMEGATFDASRRDMLYFNLPESEDAGVMLRRTLSYLEVVRAEVEAGLYSYRHQQVLTAHYADPKGWRLLLMASLLDVFAEASEIASKGPGAVSRPIVREALGRTAPPGERDRQELLRLLGEEIASIKQELEYEEGQHQELVEAERDACSAPEGRTWEVLVRQESGLDRSIDRKVRILMRLSKESPGLETAPAAEGRDIENDVSATRGLSAGDAETPAAQEDLPVAGFANQKSQERSGNVDENKGPRLVETVSAEVSRSAAETLRCAQDDSLAGCAQDDSLMGCAQGDTRA